MCAEERGVEHRMNLGFRRKLETISHFSDTLHYQKGAKESPGQLGVMVVTGDGVLLPRSQLYIDPLANIESLIAAMGVRVTLHGLLSLLQPILEFGMEVVVLL